MDRSLSGLCLAKLTADPSCSSDLYAGKNTDGNGIIYDTFRSYAGQSLCLGNIAYHNGG